MQRLHDLVRLCRPRHWTKNVFVLAPLLFNESRSLASAGIAAIVAFVCFCLWSSAVYCLNDVLDARVDRLHPQKRRRPVAAGRITVAWALGASAMVVVLTTVMATWTLPAAFVWVGMVYLANSLLYCLLLRNRVILDVLAIAIGFVLRLLAGCAAIDVVPSSWLLVCGFSLALLLGFGKRRAELTNLASPSTFRPVMECYSAAKLDVLLSIAASVCLLSYMLYTVSPETAQLHGTNKLVYTVPFVVYGIFRYVFKVHEGAGDGPVEILFQDPAFAASGVFWVIAVVAILHARG